MSYEKYFWDLNEKAIEETRNILRDIDHPKFLTRMYTLLSRSDSVKEVFELISKESFVEAWPRVRRYWLKIPEAQDFRAWWETVYEELVKIKKGPSGTPTKELSNWGGLIRKKRIQKGLSQSDFAKRVNMKQPDISAIEKGKKNITLETFIKLCKVLDIDIVLIDKNQ